MQLARHTVSEVSLVDIWESLFGQQIVYFQEFSVLVPARFINHTDKEYYTQLEGKGYTAR